MNTTALRHKAGLLEKKEAVFPSADLGSCSSLLSCNVLLLCQVAQRVLEFPFMSGYLGIDEILPLPPGVINSHV